MNEQFYKIASFVLLLFCAVVNVLVNKEELLFRKNKSLAKVDSVNVTYKVFKDSIYVEHSYIVSSIDSANVKINHLDSLIKSNLSKGVDQNVYDSIFNSITVNGK